LRFLRVISLFIIAKDNSFVKHFFRFSFSRFSGLKTLANRQFFLYN